MSSKKPGAKAPSRKYTQGMSDQSQPFVRVLSVGKSKVGKTHFALTFPDPVIANSDAGLASDVPVNCKVDPCVFPFVRWSEEISENELYSYQDLRQLALELKYRRGNMWDEITSYGYEPKTFIIDSGTSFCDLFAHEVVIADGHSDKTGKPMETLQLQDYNLIMNRFFAIIDIIKNIPMHVVMTAELADKQDDAGRRFQQPAMVGQALGDRLPHFFDEIYFHYNEVGSDKKTHFYLTPCQVRGIEFVGSRKGIPLEAHENPSFKMFEKYYVKTSSSSQKRAK
jgi:AAA domain